MRISYIKPPIGGILGLEMLTFVEPLGLECVAGALEGQGHQQQIVDLRLEGYEEGLSKCQSFDPDLVGIQCNFTTERYRTLKLYEEIRRRMPKAKVIVGGHDASRVPEWFVEKGMEIVVVGDGEDVMKLLVETLANGGDLSKSPGLYIKQGNETLNTGHAPARGELDELPLPARHLIKDYAPEYYINFRKPLALMETARGCPYVCNFCSVWKFHERTFREKSPKRVVEELKQIEADNLFVTDDIFWLNTRRGFEMAKEIQEAQVRKFFTVQTRTDLICRHPELIEEWKKCGNLAIFLGVESVSDAGLKKINKKNKVDNNRRALEILKELNVGFTSNFIVDPAWGYEEFEQLREWIRKMGAYNSGFSVLTPLPGTDLWAIMEKEVNTRNWEMYDIIHSVLPTKLPLDDFYEEYAKCWRTAMEVRYEHRGRLKTYVSMVGAVATGKVTLGSLKKGMNIAKVFSNKSTFLEAHKNDTKTEPATEAEAVA